MLGTCKATESHSVIVRTSLCPVPALHSPQVILPFAVALLLILSHQYELDPLLVMTSRSETTPFHLIEVREPYVKRLLRQRAIGMLLVTAILTAALCVLFIFVPGHRL